ncbi:MAG: hypothetical protein ACLT5H_09585 [Collinsella stercoris]|uniref:hypothetical protein n=1 Tax=Collinsella stercoris TaxID=147206 RepID=UPI003994233F
MRDLEEELSNLAKRLERIEFDRPEAREALAAAEERERKLADYIKRFEAAIVEDTRSARDQASAIQTEIDELSFAAATCSAVAEDVQGLYERSSKRFKGLCVERIQGNVRWSAAPPSSPRPWMRFVMRPIMPSAALPPHHRGQRAE